MKQLARRVFRPLLDVFERDTEGYRYRRWNRAILSAMSILFIALATVLPVLIPETIAGGYWFPMLVFGAIGLVGLIVALLGTDLAVARILGSR